MSQNMNAYHRTMKLKAIDVKRSTQFDFEVESNYSKTYSSDNLYKTITCHRQPMMSPPKQIPI